MSRPLSWFFKYDKAYITKWGCQWGSIMITLSLIIQGMAPIRVINYINYVHPKPEKLTLYRNVSSCFACTKWNLLNICFEENILPMFLCYICSDILRYWKGTIKHTGVVEYYTWWDYGGLKTRKAGTAGAQVWALPWTILEIGWKEL